MAMAMAAEESSPAATEARKQAVDRFMASLAGEMSNTADSGEIMVMAAEKKRGHY